MKYKEQPIDRMRKLAIIYRDANSIEEYKTKADLENIDRKNYLWLLDPFVLYWLVKNYGQQIRYAIGIGVQAVFITISLMFLPIVWSCIVGCVVGSIVLIIFDFGRHLASEYFV